jgi:hypothetical protein
LEPSQTPRGIFHGALASSTTAAAIHFTGGFVQYDFPKAAELRQMRNDQIAHMNYARTTKTEEKLQANDMYLTAGALVRALKKFEENLRPNARKVWDARTTGRETIDPNRVFVSSTFSACTAAPQMLRFETSTTVTPTLNVITGPTGPIQHK